MSRDSVAVSDSDSEAGALASTGVLPSQMIREMAERGQIVSRDGVSCGGEIEESQIQPASIDLRLGRVAWRVRSSFLPGRKVTVVDKIARFGMHQIDLSTGAVLEKGCVYIVELLEELRLPAGVSGLANPKSSTGRLDVFVRLITDGAVEFETVTAGYQGRLYAEISPRTFSVLVRRGSRLNQLRLRRGKPPPRDSEMARLQQTEGLVGSAEDAADIRDGVAVSVDLVGDPETGLVGYRAKLHTALIDVDQPGACEVFDYWEPIHRSVRRAPELILNPDEFYILMSKKGVSVPLNHAAEMRAYDTRVGEFRAHYAGFFDPGFGHDETGGRGSRAVLEVRSHDVPFLIEDGQTVCRMIYERMAATPDKLYGAGGLGSNYQGQGLKLSKHFRPPE